MWYGCEKTPEKTGWTVFQAAASHPIICVPNKPYVDSALSHVFKHEGAATI